MPGPIGGIGCTYKLAPYANEEGQDVFIYYVQVSSHVILLVGIMKSASNH